MGAIQYYRSTFLQKTNPFITVWNTEQPGDSASNQIMLPLVASYTYDFIVDWGDGAWNRIISSGDPNRFHTYPSAGEYEVKTYGLNALNFARTNEGPKLSKIKNWGDFKIRGGTVFYGCINLDVTATDIPDLSLATSLAGFFRNCQKLVGNSSFALWDTAHIQFFGTGNNGFIRSCPLFNAPISGWNTSSATAYNEFAFGASSLDQNFGNYNMENTTSIGNMFRDSGLSVENYSNTLIGWASQNLKPNLTLRSRGLKYNAAGQAARQYIIDNFNWTILEDSLAV